MWLLKAQETKRPTIKKKTNEYKRCVHETMIWMPLVVTWRNTIKKSQMKWKISEDNFNRAFYQAKMVTWRKLSCKECDQQYS